MTDNDIDTGWHADDDERVRAALASLRHDVDALPLTDPHFLRAEGARRRRNRQLAWTSGIAAAAVAVAAIGFSQLARPTASSTDPASSGTSTSSSPSPSSSSSAPSSSGQVTPTSLHVLTKADWATVVGATPLTLVDAAADEAADCAVPPDLPGTAHSVHAGSADAEVGGQSIWVAPSATAAATAASALAEGMTTCAAPFQAEVISTDTAMRLWRWSTPDAGTGWWMTNVAGSEVGYLWLADPEGDPWTREQVTSLGMRVLGTSPEGDGAPEASALSGEMFVPAADWSSQALTKGHPTAGAQLHYEGQDTLIATLLDCDSDNDGLSGDPFAASDTYVGDENVIIQGIQDTTTGSFVGRQRVRLFASAAAAADYSAQLQSTVADGCTFANGKTTAEAGDVDGTWATTTTYNDGDPVTRYVAVTTAGAPNAIITIVLDGVTDQQAGLDEVARLAAKARG
ncbi:hypothetical protein [Janibacter sp. G1551]|uniref:hypothetical protein n=1 Tax=Janibacter sp. G1551 TaxID=3420440 RepID=UPI003CFE31C7